MPQDKTLWKNNTKAKAEGGYTIGVSVYDHENKQTSIPLLPDETVWLTVDERVLTANAPREEKDNPFTNGDLLQVNEEFRPIGRAIGGGTTTTGEPLPADEPAPEEEAAPDPAPEPEAPAAPEDHTVAPPAPSGITELPPELRLGGDNDTEAGEPPAVSGAVQVTDGGTVEEEHASAPAGATVAEEVGSAVPPAGDPPVGEYAKDEEVGTPTAPAEETADVPPPPPPADVRPGTSPDPIDQEMGLHALTPEAEKVADKGADGKFGG